jgi:sugar phosphate permease
MTQRSATVREPGVTRQGRIVARSPIYYGWIILVAAAIGRIMTSPGQTYSVSIFIQRFIQDLGISRSLVSTLYTLGTLAGGLALPYVGRQIDRRGPRAMVGIITALFAVACVYMGFVRNAVMLGLGFVLIRMLGQGSLGLVCSNVVNRWWVRRRGAILGLLGMATSVLGTGAFPSLIDTLIERFGWRASYMLLGGLVAVVMLPVGLIFFRRQPEDYGLLPDGAKAAPSGAQEALDAEVHWTREEAVRTSAFWILSLGGACISMLGTGLHFHMVSIFEDAGLSASAAAAAFMPLAVTGAVIRVASGVLVDRIPVRYVLSAALVGLAASLWMAPRLAGTTSALIYGIILGATGSLQLTVGQVVWAKYYGRRHLGSVTGVAMLISIVGSALGPMPMGVARDLMGSYLPALSISAALPVALAVVALFARRPERKPRLHG